MRRSPLRAILNPTGLGFSQMNENALRRIAFLWMIPQFRANWGAVHAFNRANSKQMNKKNENSSKIH
jgi:hypothetical protein